MKRKCYAIVTLTITREIEFYVDDDNIYSLDDQMNIIEPIIEEKYGKLGETDEFEIEESDYAE